MNLRPRAFHYERYFVLTAATNTNQEGGNRVRGGASIENKPHMAFIMELPITARNRIKEFHSGHIVLYI